MIFFKLRSFALSFLLIISTLGLFAQDDYKNEADLKKGADELFEQKKYVEATQLFSQLISLYPKTLAKK